METPDPKYKHKPSEKHTLEEVLKSLQDLIRNDFSESTAGTNKPITSATEARHPDTTPEPKQRRESKPVAREDFAPVSPGSGPVNLDAVMRSLKDLIGNELNVGDAPKPASEMKSAAHDEYLSAEEKIEEYIPEELADLDNELTIDEAPATKETKSAPSRYEFPAPEEITAASLPEELTPFGEDLTIEAPSALESPYTLPVEPAEPSGEIAAEPTPSMVEPVPEEFTPLDEELTFEEPLEAAPPPAVPTVAAELPGEISPELFEEPVTPPPAAVTSMSAPEVNLAAGTQHEMFLETSSPRPSEPEAVATDSAPATAADAAPVDQHEQPMEAKQESVPEALPTIEVEESFDDHDYFAATPPSASESEETIAVDAEITSEPEIVATPAAEPTAPPAPPEIAAAPESPVASVKTTGKKITLETANEPTPEWQRDGYSVDFNSSDLSPPLPEESDIAPPQTSSTIASAEEKFQHSYSVDFESSDLSPPLPEESDLASSEAGASAENEPPVELAKADSFPAPESKPAAPPPEPPAVETKSETPAETESPPQITDTAVPEAEASAASNLDDIPVLNEVVAPPAGRVSKTKPSKPSPKPSLPAPDRAREIVVRAVAKLNVEMRKTGSAGLDTKTILRLQQLIRQELEKGGEK
ncbi:MAG: hypothetical protein NUV55_09815 [Sulfuricaulis sp.]|uniref:hypothetical protein n=1 Tax=Sulfuricaulis sp. TaxID=2003553 RepID=UPI0025EE306E|nr:hypothetical protein [Sulfuricaulis sp.]MCR4347479.1 hypothetical protein [Sulfuricaulis sp.]